VKLFVEFDELLLGFVSLVFLNEQLVLVVFYFYLETRLQRVRHAQFLLSNLKILYDFLVKPWLFDAVNNGIKFFIDASFKVGLILSDLFDDLIVKCKSFLEFFVERLHHHEVLCDHQLINIVL
jgi:hypothetical protein